MDVQGQMRACRSSKCTFPVNVPGSHKLSRQHVRVQLDAHGTAWAENLASHHVRLNNVEFGSGRRVPLNEGDMITVRSGSLVIIINTIVSDC